MTRPRLLVVQHEDECPPAWFGEWLADEGVVLDVVLAHRGEPVPEAPEGADGVLVLGGHMGANDDAAHPWLAPTKELIRGAVGTDVPFLGICLGHQLAVAALGGEVRPNERGTTRGVVQIGLTDAGRADALFGPHDQDPSVHWNGDIAVRLPSHATVLATAPDGSVQAARFGPQAWGVQFHPEASPAVVAGWAVERPPGRGVPPKVQVAVDAVAAAEDRLRSAWAPLARQFAALLG
jgi:GMP synthase (glutamine-hydrolysing)